MTDTFCAPSVTNIECPHCHAEDTVRTKQMKHKSGSSGGKATAAALAAGLSVLATGLSRKEKRTQLTCGACKVPWLV